MLDFLITIFTNGFLAVFAEWFIGILAFWGLLDIYAMMRFRKNTGVDKTAIVGNWLSLKWMFASRVDEMVEKHPWLSQDLSEVLGEKEDDGEVT